MNGRAVGAPAGSQQVRYPPPPRGVHPILYALFDHDGGLDRRAMRRQIEICIGMGAAGITTLGLATEVRLLDAGQRRRIVEWNAEDVAGRLPLGVTIFGATVAEQVELLRHAVACGADWVILQPLARAADAAAVERGFDEVLGQCPLPAALQNVPQFLGVGLSAAAIAALAARHRQLVAIKQEVPVLETAALVEAVGGRLEVFSGRGGIELVDCIMAGIAGHVPAPEYADHLIALWRLMDQGETDAAWALYRRVLPLATYLMQSLDMLTTYGKLLFCLRNDLPFHPRPGAAAPTGAGVRLLMGHAAHLGIDTAPWQDRLPGLCVSGPDAKGAA